MSEDPSPVCENAAVTTVAALRPDTSGHNLIVQVTEAKTVIDRPAKGAQKAQKIAECTVGDETGVITFSARNDQVDLMKPGAYLSLKNAKVEMFKSTMRLVVDTFGKVEAAEGADFKPNADFNLSSVEFELVPVNAPKKKPEGKAAEAPETLEAPADDA